MVNGEREVVMNGQMSLPLAEMCCVFPRARSRSRFNCVVVRSVLAMKIVDASGSGLLSWWATSLRRLAQAQGGVVWKKIEGRLY
jgi:hypothetical protein